MSDGRFDSIVGAFVSSVLSLLVLTQVGCGSDEPPVANPANTSAATKKQSVPFDPVQRIGGDDTKLDRDWLQDETLEVARGVFVLGELQPSAAYAIRTSDGVILVDSGGDQDCVVLRQSLLQCGITLKEIRYVLLTHSHYDHVFGANRVKKIADAKIVAGRGEVDVLKSLDHYGIYSLFKPTEYSGGAIDVDVPVTDGDTITCGDTSITAIAAPGHTAGSTCYLLERAGQRILFSGDVVASLNLGPATYPVNISPRYRGNASDYLATVDKLLQIESPDLLLPGHPRQQLKRDAIAIPEEKWRSLLGHARGELQTVVAQHDADGKDFLDGNACQIESNLFYFGDIDSIAIYALKTAEGIVVINAPGGDRFANVVSARLKEFGLSDQRVAAVLLTSSDPQSYLGVHSLESDPLVFAPSEFANAGDKTEIPNLHSHDLMAEKLASLDESFQAIEFRDHLGSCVAYRFVVGEKIVIATPNAPRNIALIWTNRETGRVMPSGLHPQSRQLDSELQADRAAPELYAKAVESVGQQMPDIWLPAVPMTGQNANLYGEQWSNVIKANLARTARFPSQN